MKEFWDKFQKDLKEIGRQIQAGFYKLIGKKPPQAATGSVINNQGEGSYEINLVPAVKAQMIKAQKVRNLVLFICILVSSIAAGAVIILFGIKSGQDIAIANQDGRLERLSVKLNEYSELDSLLMIQSQLSTYQELVDQKKMLSRVFGALAVMKQQGSDSVSFSEIRADMATGEVAMEGQVDARVLPDIDYRVLEAFKKSVGLTKFDYGRYVDVDGEELPTQCITEADASGNAFRAQDENGTKDDYYAWWDLTIKGCEGSPRSLSVDFEETPYHYGANAEVEMGYEGRKTQVVEICDYDEAGKKVNCRKEIEVLRDDGTVDTEIDKGALGELVAKRVKIWRTPQFDLWYKQGQMSLDGAITGVEHFESACYNYSGTEIEQVMGQYNNKQPAKIRWNSTNECMLAPDGLDVTESMNGRDESDKLVLRFEANMVFAEEFFSFQNKHMIAIGPMGQNVTDSYIQIGNMFAKEAKACAEGDTECLNGTTNSGGN